MYQLSLCTTLDFFPWEKLTCNIWMYIQMNRLIESTSKLNHKLMHRIRIFVSISHSKLNSQVGSPGFTDVLSLGLLFFFFLSLNFPLSCYFFLCIPFKTLVCVRRFYRWEIANISPPENSRKQLPLSINDRVYILFDYLQRLSVTESWFHVNSCS